MENLKYTEILQLNKALTGKIETKPYKIGVLANVTVNSFREILEYGCRINQIEPDVELGNYDNIVQDSSAFATKDLVIIFYDAINLVDNISAFFEDIDEDLYDNLKRKIFAEIDIIFENLKNIPSVVFNRFSATCFISDYVHQTKIEMFVKELNSYLEKKKTGNVSILNIDKIFSNIGVKQAIDYRFYHSSKAPYTFAFFKNYVSAIEGIILRNTGKLKKAVIFDCDNTLWKGIIGEDGVEQIDMSASSKNGRFYRLIQQTAVFLSKRGIIVGICSKNNESDVTEVFKNHPDIVLKEEHIVIKKINWQDKATNLRAIAAELNIGIDSLVFVDDSSFEINLIKEQLPEIVTVQVPTNITEYSDFLLRHIYKYFNLNPTGDDTKKTEMYKQQFQRETAKGAFASLNDYLASLEIELGIVKDDSAFVPRIAQLTQKTNQFNLTTYRYTESQIEQFMVNEKQSVFALFVKDKFGDNGLTGVCIAKVDEQNAENVLIDTFLMSCRIIGRNIEYVFFNNIVKDLIEKGYETLTARFVPTKKNSLVENFYETAGLKLIKTEENSKFYFLTLKEFSDQKLDYIKVSQK